MSRSSVSTIENAGKSDAEASVRFARDDVPKNRGNVPANLLHRKKTFLREREIRAAGTFL